MTVLIISLITAMILPYLVKIPVALAMHRLGGYDNKLPRAQQARLEGMGARALAAHQNSFESLIVFAGAISVALATANYQPLIQYFALLHIAARITYVIFYIKDWDKLRSIVWCIGFLASIAIAVLCVN